MYNLSPNSTSYYDSINNDSINAPNVLLIPFWIKKTLEITQINLIDLINKKKLLDKLSRKDVCDLLFLNLYFKHQKNLSYLKSSLNLDVNDSLLSELSLHIELNRENYEYQIRSLFSTNKEDNVTYYEIKIQENNIIVFLEPGFFRMGEEEHNSFLKDILKALYSLLPVNEVSKLPVFLDYIQTLKREV